MEEFTKRLNNIQDTYYGFIVAVLTYVKKSPSSSPTTGFVIHFLLSLSQFSLTP